MHFERGNVDQETRADELVVHVMIAQDVANVLAQKAFDTFAKFLNAVNVRLRNTPAAVGSVGRTHLETGDALLHAKIPGNVGDQILHVRERLHGLDGDRLIERDGIEAGHTHELGHAVDLCGAGAALAGLAIPARGEIAGAFCLNLVDGVEHDHALGDFGGEVLKGARASFSTPDATRRGGHYFISSMICWNSGGMGGNGSWINCTSPSGPLRATMLNLP